MLQRKHIVGPYQEIWNAGMVTTTNNYKQLILYLTCIKSKLTTRSMLPGEKRKWIYTFYEKDITW